VSAELALTGADARREHRRGQLYIVIAAIAWSSAGLLQRALSVDTATQAAGRACFAFLALLGYSIWLERGGLWRAFRSLGLAGLGFSALLGISSLSFLVALNHTTVANVLFMQAVSPVFAAALGALLLGEAVGRRQWAAMAVALVGVGLMVGGPGHVSATANGLPLLMSLSFAGALVLARRRRDVSMAPATCLSQLLVIAAAGPLSHPETIGGQDLLLLVALGGGQIGLGLVFLTLGAQLIPAAEVALISLLEVVLGPLWVLLARGERPDAATLAGGAIVVAAVVVQARASPSPSLPPAA
jgi:drug/metabolite transporter (DMT)-like permease